MIPNVINHFNLDVTSPIGDYDPQLNFLASRVS